MKIPKNSFNLYLVKKRDYILNFVLGGIVERRRVRIHHLGIAYHKQ